MFKINDEVIIKIDPENRSWGYNPCPDGTIATVIGFGEITYGHINNYGRRPGVHVNDSWVDVRFESGAEINISSTNLTIRDVKLRARRKAQYRAKIKRQRNETPEERYNVNTFLRDLPELPFWEWDVVVHDDETHKIVGIDYHNIGRKRDNGSPMPIYLVGEDGWHRYADGDELTLVRRGNVWKYYNNEPIQFDSIMDEANLHSALGLTYDIRNPKNDLYSWTKNEVLGAIKKGIAHGFKVNSGLFGIGPRPYAIKFRDEELGKRVAAATLAGF